MAKLSTKKSTSNSKEVENKSKKTVKNKGELSVLVKINETPFEFSCNTPEEVLEGILSLDSSLLKTRLVVQITKDGKTIDKLLQLQDAKRLFYNKVAQEMFVKRLIV